MAGDWLHTLVVHFQNPINVGKAVAYAITAGTTCMLYLFKKDGNTKKLQSADRDAKPTPLPTPSLELDLARANLEIATLKVRVERAEWSSSEWEQQYRKLDAEHNKLSAEFAVTRERLQTYDLREAQRLERQSVFSTEESVKLPRARPPLPRRSK